MAMFTAVNYWVVLAAAVAGFALGMIWYRTLAKPWAAATGIAEQMADAGARSPPYGPLAITFVAELLMAAMLYGVIWHVSAAHFTVKGGVIAGALCWLGFVITVMAVDNAFARRKRVLLLIDGGYWLLTLLLMGAIVGWLGPS